MKFRIKITSQGIVGDFGCDGKQYRDSKQAVDALYPNAKSSFVTRTGDVESYRSTGEDGLIFYAEAAPVFDGSESETATAIGRNLDARDWGKTATEIIQGNEAREEARRD